MSSQTNKSNKKRISDGFLKRVNLPHPSLNYVVCLPSLNSTLCSVILLPCQIEACSASVALSSAIKGSR